MAISLTEFMQNMKYKEQHEIKKPISEIVDRNGHIGRIPKSSAFTGFVVNVMEMV